MRKPCLYVCTTCTGVAAEGARSAADYDAAGEPRPGMLLYRQVLAQAGALADAPPVEIHPITCLANCANGCSAAIAQPGKWGYLLGRLAPATAADLIAYGTRYGISASGTVMRRNRPASLHDAIMARFPNPTQDAAAEAFLNRTVTP